MEKKKIGTKRENKRLFYDKCLFKEIEKAMEEGWSCSKIEMRNKTKKWG